MIPIEVFNLYLAPINFGCFKLSTISKNIKLAFSKSVFRNPWHRMNVVLWERVFFPKGTMTCYAAWSSWNISFHWSYSHTHIHTCIYFKIIVSYKSVSLAWCHSSRAKYLSGMVSSSEKYEIQHSLRNFHGLSTCNWNCCLDQSCIPFMVSFCYQICDHDDR